MPGTPGLQRSLGAQGDAVQQPQMFTPHLLCARHSRKCVSCVTSSPREATQRDGHCVSPFILQTSLCCPGHGSEQTDGPTRTCVCVSLEPIFQFRWWLGWELGNQTDFTWPLSQSFLPPQIWMPSPAGPCVGPRAQGPRAVPKPGPLGEPRPLGGRCVLQSLLFTVEMLSSPCAQGQREAAEVLKKESRSRRNGHVS